MNRLRLTSVSVVVALAVIGMVYASTQTRRPSVGRTDATKARTQTITAEKILTTQQRLNRHFHNDVIPKLAKCWNGIQGKGQVEVEHNYLKSPEGRWSAGNLTVTRSDLPKGQDQVALQCLQAASRGTSFAVQADETSTRYVARWTWPVPFPTNASQLTANMFAARVKDDQTDGGCDGKGAIPKCWTCNSAGSCTLVCVGYKKCTSGTGPACFAEDACASGGPFGVAGQAVIY